MKTISTRSPGGAVRFRWRFLLFGLLLGVALHAVLFSGTFRPHELAITLAITMAYGLVMWGALTRSGFLLTRHIPLDSRKAFLIHAGVQAAVMVAAFLLVTWGIGAATGLTFMNQRGTMIVIGLVALCTSLAGNGIYYLTLFYRRMRDAENAALRAELGALRAQINPHFLFNSLNSVAALIRIDPAEAEQVVESLADLFRYSLRSSRQPLVTLAEEIDSVELYLAVERARFRDRLRVRIDIPETLRDARMPSLLLQPLAENGVKHGAGGIAGPCDVSITAAPDGDKLRIRVTDNGPGFPSLDPEEILRRGNGLANVMERLRIQFGDEGELRIERNGVEIAFPYSASRERGAGRSNPVIQANDTAL